jgi:protein phosphatase 1 regulatory subunit 7
LKGLENLTQLKYLYLQNNPDLTKAQIDELQKALPKCRIGSNPPLTKEELAKVIERNIRSTLKKPTGELTKADLEKVTRLQLNGAGKGRPLTSVRGLEKLTQLKYLTLNLNQLTSLKGLENLTQLTYLYLHGNQLTSLKGLENLTQLKYLYLQNNPDLTKAQIDELQKALPNCTIYSNPKK